MKRYLILACAALALGGCASMWKSLGVATEKSVADTNADISKQVGDLKVSVDELKAASAEITTLRKDIDELSPISQEVKDLRDKVDQIAMTVDETKSAVAEIGQIRELLGELQGKTEQLPRETIQKLADILAKAVEELSAAAAKSQ
jgi:DNA repair exonuclease SbcCD ATPase subunit